MKKSLLLVFLLLSLPLVYSIETNLKPVYQPGETLIVEISGNFLDNIQEKDVQFYSLRTFIPMIYDIAKINDKYYLYALLPDKERNYTLIINNARFYELGEQQRDLSYNFSASGNETLFSVNPGFVIVNSDFSIKVESKIKNIQVKAVFMNTTQELEVRAGKTVSFSFPISSVQSTSFQNIIFSSEGKQYTIPVYVFLSANNSYQPPKHLRFSKSLYSFTIIKGVEKEFELSLSNIGQKDITNIKFNISEVKDMMAIKSGIANLSSGNSGLVNLTVNYDKEGIYQGSIEAYSENNTARADVYVNVVKDVDSYNVAVQDNVDSADRSCSDYGGDFCESTEYCDSTSVPTIEGKLCCLGVCQATKSESSGGLGKGIAITIVVVIVLIIGFFLYKKFKLRNRSSGDILKDKAKAFEERFRSKEVKGELTRT